MEKHSYFEFREKSRTVSLVFFTLLLVIICFKLVHDLFKDINDYNLKKGYLFSTRYKTEEYTIKSKTKISYTLVLQLNDETEWYLHDYSEYWKHLTNKENIGKPIKLWYSDNNVNPVQIEINDKTIYTIKEHNYITYIIILLTIGLIIYTVIEIKNIFKKYE
ncbi:MAG: hypothetical protein DI539_08750 [Flavobacterium psychrophilum]|nr:MAG: hypothetical protein DI539_08750 [Flavobacterium psychrophilum]